MYAVCVKPQWREEVCENPELIWVKDQYHHLYVTQSERGVWPTRGEAEKNIAEGWEGVVEVDATEVLTDAQRIEYIEKQRDALLADVERCYRMLLSEPNTKGALFKAENILRDAIAAVRGAA